jgi:hypothetical protein
MYSHKFKDFKVSETETGAKDRNSEERKGGEDTWTRIIIY